MGPLAAIVGLFWAAAGIAVAINISEKQESIKGAAVMMLCQVGIIAFALMPIVFGIVNAS